MNRYDLTDFEWSAIDPLLPSKPRGVPRVDDRRVLNGIMWVLLSGALAGPAGALRALHHLLQPLQSLAQEGHLGSPDGRHRRGLRRRHTDDRQLQRPGSPARSGLKKGGPDRCMGRSRGGLTTKIHTVVIVRSARVAARRQRTAAPLPLIPVIETENSRTAWPRRRGKVAWCASGREGRSPSGITPHTVSRAQVSAHLCIV